LHSLSGCCPSPRGLVGTALSNSVSHTPSRKCSLGFGCSPSPGATLRPGCCPFYSGAGWKYTLEKTRTPSPRTLPAAGRCIFSLPHRFVLYFVRGGDGILLGQRAERELGVLALTERTSAYLSFTSQNKAHQELGHKDDTRSGELVGYQAGRQWSCESRCRCVRIARKRGS